MSIEVSSGKMQPFSSRCPEGKKSGDVWLLRRAPSPWAVRPAGCSRQEALAQPKFTLQILVGGIWCVATEVKQALRSSPAAL